VDKDNRVLVTEFDNSDPRSRVLEVRKTMRFQKGNKARPDTKIFPVIRSSNNVQKRLIWDYRYFHSWSGVGALWCSLWHF
jgi:hypothetical protein